jgi:uncharacterized protein
MPGVPMFPLSGVFIPGDVVSLRVFEPRYVAMCKDILASDSMTFATVMITAGSEVGGKDRRGEYGVHVSIQNMYVTDDGGYVLIGLAGPRCKVLEWLPDDPYPKANLETTMIATVPSEMYQLLCRRLTVAAQRVRSLVQQLADRRNIQMEPLPQLTRVAGGQWIPDHVHPSALDSAFWDVIRHVPCGPQDRYALLCADDAEKQMVILDRVLEHVAEVIAFEGT